MAKKKKKKLKYDNIWDYFLEAHEQPTPKGFQPITKRNGQRPTFLTPEDMMSLLNAISPYDLYNKPDVTPKEGQFDYPTSAFNIDNRRYGKIGIPEAIIMASQGPKKLLPIYEMDTARKNYSDIPEWFQRFIPQGIYEHEVGHSEDPRLNPEAKNYGWLVRNGLQGNVATREDVGMQAENKFWELLLSNKDFVKFLLRRGNRAAPK